MADVTVRRAGSGRAIDPPLHFDVSPVQVLGLDDDACPWAVVRSTYHVGGTAAWAKVAVDTVYVVLSGDLNLTLQNAEHHLSAGDTVHVAAGTFRSLTNTGQEAAQVLVIRPRQ
ncbi:cupin domain-containing protein [Herbidospora sp. RD11066]